ncbi:NACHT domain-containing protein [Methylomonas sp. ZR1]|uniref:NACHT domain-containing protein n=1 Tax=Methylomonas sp. ZR1 TaxID=1797072 RepID=UPI0014929FEB|nr:NACHT domain-containing protein [Methylomonas sp. ZR1]NOV29218.1 NACHT domain-containing protein [Methylomonas sp. ZR1]
MLLSTSQTLTPIQEPDTGAFIDIKNNHALLSYFQNLQRHFMVANNFGLALDDEDRPDTKTAPAYLRNLFVPPHLGERHYDPEQLINMEVQGQNQHWLDAVEVLKQNPRMFLLGDPGAGKSTLLSWLMLAFSYSGENLTKMQLGERVPFLLVLRDLPLSQVRDWDTLWQVFLNKHLDHLAAPLQEQVALISQLFESGQAFLLIDGLDEVTEEKSRTYLGKAVLDGINRFPRCVFMMTSRLLGFDQLEWFGQKVKRYVPAYIDSAIEIQNTQIQLDATEADMLLKAFELTKKTIPEKKLQYFAKTIHVRNTHFFELPVFYLAPFDLPQTRLFIENWYRQYLSADHALPQRINDLQKRIEANDGLGRLARIPVLLNMICFIHSRRGRLPDGRAELYQRIAETYLTGLDRARGLKFLGREFNYDYLDLSEWLGKLALQLQDKRGEDDQALLIEKPDIETLLKEELQSRGMPASQIPEEIDFVLRYLAERSGLFIPRGFNQQGVEQYGFTHLSFLEYFAAYALKQEAQVDSDCLVYRRETTQLPRWHECWALFFEQIEHSRLTDKYLELLFPNTNHEKFPTGLLSSLTRQPNLIAQLLCAKIVMDSAVRLGFQVRQKMLINLWAFYLTQNQYRFVESDDYQYLCELLWSDRFDSRNVFSHLVHQAKISELSLSGEAIGDLKPVENLLIESLDLYNSNLSGDWLHINVSTLKNLKLKNIDISDLTVLDRFEALNRLTLEKLSIKDLSPLKALKPLTSLSLSNCPNIDLASLTKLTKIKKLYILEQSIDDASPLAKLKHLEQLFLLSMSIDSFAALGNCQKLKQLILVNVKTPDWTSLAKLENLKILTTHLLYQDVLNNWPTLENINCLYISSSNITDVTPLAGFINLVDLDISGTKVNDISPLKSLKKLKQLFLPSEDINGIELFDKKILKYRNIEFNDSEEVESLN